MIHLPFGIVHLATAAALVSVFLPAASAAEGPHEDDEYVIIRRSPRVPPARGNIAAELVRFPQLRRRGDGAKKVDRCRELRAVDAEITACSPNYRKELYTVPNDGLFSELWAMNNTAGADIRAADAWNLHKGSSRGVVAVVDTGVDYNHPDLSSNIWRNPGEIAGNGVDDDENGYIDDVVGISVDPNDRDPRDRLGHGTHLAGIIAAQGDNGIGVTGVNWFAQIIPVHFIDGTRGSIFDLLTALNYVLDLKLNRGIDIVAVNASFGSNQFSQTEYEAVRALRDAGILLIAAAGNESVDNDRKPSYPANYVLENVISVAALARNGELASFSNRGAATVHLAAPGVSIVSTMRDGGYAPLSGTSMAAPFVTGAAALLHSYRPDLDLHALKRQLVNGVSYSPSLTGMVTTSGGLNLFAVLAGAASSTGQNPNAGYYRLFAGNAHNGSRRVQRGARIDLIIVPSIPPAAPETIAVDVMVGHHRCPDPIYATGSSEFFGRSYLPSAKAGVRITFSVRNSAGSVTSTEWVRVAGGKLKTKARQRSLGDFCREFLENTRFH